MNTKNPIAAIKKAKALIEHQKNLENQKKKADLEKTKNNKDTVETLDLIETLPGRVTRATKRVFKEILQDETKINEVEDSASNNRERKNQKPSESNPTPKRPYTRRKKNNKTSYNESGKYVVHSNYFKIFS
jgi:hypothetical protein